MRWLRTVVPCLEKAKAFEGLSRKDAAKGTQAVWKEQTGCLRLEDESSAAHL